MKVKAIILDLDDTLFDCTGTLVDNARKRAAKAMASSGFPLTEKEIYKRIVEFSEKKGPRENVFDMLCEMHEIKEKVRDNLVNAAINAYNSDKVEDIKLFDDVIPTLKALKSRGCKLVLLTSGLHKRQEKKIRLLGLEKFFDVVIINDIEKGSTKEDDFAAIINRLRVRPEEVVSVGDRIFSEIKISNRLGINTVQMVHGRFRDLKPKNEMEEPDYRIRRISELPGVLERIERGRLRIVAIGGGTGLPNLLKGLKKHTNDLTAVVTVTDTGRSSGMIRKELNVLPPGDIRNCLIALADAPDSLKGIFQYRFNNGSLNGHSFGNIFIAALTKVTGSFEGAIKEASKILGLKGRVLPSTLEDANICAELEDGTMVRGEVDILTRKDTSPIKRLFLDPDNAKAFDDVTDAIKQADLIVLGPGCLFTSIISNLLIGGIADSIRKSKAKRIYVCNIATQPGQTDKFVASDHLRMLTEYLGCAVDFAILNSMVPDRKILERYERDGSFLVKNDIEKIENMGTKVVLADMMDENPRADAWSRKDFLRHDPDKLAGAVMGCLR